MIAFTNTADKLLVQIPVLIKVKTQIPLSLYSIHTVPVPLDEQTYIGKNNQYTLIQQEFEYIAMNSDNYVPMSQQQLRLCMRIGFTYYCENTHLLRNRQEHTCTSAIYYDADSEVIANNCSVKVHYNVPQKAQILDAGDKLLLFNLPKPWLLVCQPANRPFEIEYSAYRVINRTELCECSLSAGNYFLSQAAESCDDTTEATDGIFTTYYSFNKIVFDFLEAKFDFKFSEHHKNLMKTLQPAIPIYDLPEIRIYKADKNPRVLNDKTDEVFADIEEVLVTMIENQNIELYKSDKDFYQGQRQFKRFMAEAAMWEKISLILTWVSTTLTVFAMIMLFALCYQKRRYIEGLIGASLANAQYDDNYVMVPKTKAFPVSRLQEDLPFFTLHPNVLDELKTEDDGPSTKQATTLISSIFSAFIIACIVIMILVAIWK